MNFCPRIPTDFVELIMKMSEYIHQDDAYTWLRDKEIVFAEQDFAKVQAERDELKLKVLELYTEVERLSRELARC